MTELIKVTKNENGNNVVSAKELYDFLGHDKGQWSRWYKTNILENLFTFENQDWVGFDTMSNGNKSKDFIITIDFAKRLAMMAKTQKGEEIRTYFIECEKQLKQSLPQTYIESLLALVASEQEKERLALQVDNLSTALDVLVEWVSIIKVANFNNVSETNFDWRKLKSKSEEMGFVIKKAASPCYGYQNLYHILTFKACYPQFKYNFTK